MAIVLAALMPVFLLIVLGFVLKRSVMRLGDYSAGCDRPRGP
jgi:malonate transporter and related proteins